MPRISFYTVGCKLNSYETEMLQHQFARAGYEIVPFGDSADITVVNTCTVTENADADCRKVVRRAHREGGEPMVVVTGCMAERMAEPLSDMPEVGLVVGNARKTALLTHVEDMRSGRRTERVVLDAKAAAPAFLNIAPTEQARDHMHTRATLQVQDGCDEHCTYCIIPSVRGVSRSRPIEEVVTHAHTMVAAGYREIALTGVNTGSWGEETGAPTRLIDVLKAVCDVPGVERIRINSMEPNTIDSELIDYLTSDPKICRHYHIPLQSGSDRVLKRMNRRYRSDHYAWVITELATRQPNAAIGADVMVGFPGETDNEFMETFSLIERLPMTYLHVFSFSPREGTAAMNLPGHHTRATKDRRSRDLRKLGLEKREAFHLRHVGATMPVLIEDSRDGETGQLRGLTDNYIRVTVDAPDDAINQIVPVRITSADAVGALGDMVEHADVDERPAVEEAVR